MSGLEFRKQQSGFRDGSIVLLVFFVLDLLCVFYPGSLPSTAWMKMEEQDWKKRQRSGKESNQKEKSEAKGRTFFRTEKQI